MAHNLSPNRFAGFKAVMVLTLRKASGPMMFKRDGKGWGTAMSFLQRIDAWLGKTLFHPPVILLCQITRQT